MKNPELKISGNQKIERLNLLRILKNDKTIS